MISGKKLVEGALIFVVGFFLIEIYYANNRILPNEFVFLLLGILIIGIIAFFTYFYDRVERKLGGLLLELIIVGLSALMVLTPFAVHCCYPDTVESSFKNQCTNVTCKELEEKFTSYEGKKVLITGKMEDYSHLGDSWLLIVNDDSISNKSVAVFFNGKLPNKEKTLLVYGIVYGKREFNGTQNVNPAIFASYIDEG